jgi:DNA polymerase-4
MSALCRDCCAAWTPPEDAAPQRCPSCGGPRLIAHPELHDLAIAHLDCDAFYAAVEKRDDPSLRDRPVIVGGGRRGVVTTACYIARLSGVRSAMPMFEALRLCPQATVVKPRMAVYVAESRRIRALLDALTPLVEPLSLDEAFLDLSGTARLHRASPATLMARLQARIEAELGLTVSVGLSHNKFLAKVATELGKPRGFRAIGRAETLDFLAPRPLALIPGVGPRAVEELAREGLRTFADLRGRERKALIARFGAFGDRLWRLARGDDDRPVAADRPQKSVSNETTLAEDAGSLDALEPVLWRLAEQVSGRLKAGGLAGRVVTLKLKRADHVLLTRRQTLPAPAQMADSLYGATRPMLQREMVRGPFRLVGLGVSALSRAGEGAAEIDLLDPNQARRHAAERTADAIRKRFGPDAIALGRGLR